MWTFFNCVHFANIKFNSHTKTYYYYTTINRTNEFNHFALNFADDILFFWLRDLTKAATTNVIMKCIFGANGEKIEWLKEIYFIFTHNFRSLSLSFTISLLSVWVYIAVPVDKLRHIKLRSQWHNESNFQNISIVYVVCFIF